MRLYHNAASSCSQKVRMVLAEKNLGFDSALIDLQSGEQFDPEYVKLNPNAVVPTLDDNGEIIIESTLINEYLDDAYPEVSLKPDSAAARHQMRLFCKKIDDALHPACGIATYAIAVRVMWLQKPKHEVDAMVDQIPNKARRAIRRSVIDHGVHAPEFVDAYATHREIFDQANALLENNTWLMGDALSLADCALMPYALRFEHLNQGQEISSRVHLQRWFSAIQARPSFAVAVSEWLPQPIVDLFKQAGAAVDDDIKSALQS